MELWSADYTAGYVHSDQLSDTLRTAMQPMARFRQHCDAEDASAKGLHNGAQFYWDVYSNVSDAGGALTENEPMPKTGYTKTQSSLVVTEYGKLVAALFFKQINNLCAVIFSGPVACGA